MTNLDSLQASNPQLSQATAGSRSPRAQAPAPQPVAAPQSSDAQVLTPSGKVLPQEAKPAPQSALQRTEQIEAVVEKLSDFAQSLSRALTFSVDDITGQTVIVVTDDETDEVVRQIPSEELLELARKLQELEDSQQKLDNSAGNLLKVRV